MESNFSFIKLYTTRTLNGIQIPEKILQNSGHDTMTPLTSSIILPASPKTFLLLSVETTTKLNPKKTRYYHLARNLKGFDHGRYSSFLGLLLG